MFIVIFNNNNQQSRTYDLDTNISLKEIKELYCGFTNCEDIKNVYAWSDNPNPDSNVISPMINDNMTLKDYNIKNEYSYIYIATIL